VTDGDPKAVRALHCSQGELTVALRKFKTRGTAAPTDPCAVHDGAEPAASVDKKASPRRPFEQAVIARDIEQRLVIDGEIVLGERIPGVRLPSDPERKVRDAEGRAAGPFRYTSTLPRTTT
jgi:hypothetical protein